MSGPPLLGRTVAAVVLDWDGTAVADRSVSAAPVRERLERLSALGVHAAVVSGTHLANVDGQLGARPPGPGRLLLALNRGSELFEVTRAGPVLLRRREEDPRVRQQLDATAHDVAEELRRRGLDVAVVAHRLNRTKVDLLPDPAWRDPPKSRLGEVLDELTRRLAATGCGSLAETAALARRVAGSHGLRDAHITSDAKHLEIGTTDKGDSMRAVLEVLDAVGVGPGLVLVVGDELGDLAGLPGSDARMLVGGTPAPVAVSVGVEPHGVPDGVRLLGGGPPVLLALLDEQLHRAEALRVPEVCHDPRWTVVERGVDPARLRVTESLFTLGSDGTGWRGSAEETPVQGQPLVTSAGVYAGADPASGLLEGPDLADVSLAEPVRHDVRTLDLRTGVLHREETGPGATLRSLRLASATEPGVFALRVEAAEARLRAPGSGPDAGTDTEGWSLVTSTTGGGIGALSRERSAHDAGTTALERLTVVRADAHRAPPRSAARGGLDRARVLGFERLLSAQRAAWAARWDRVGVSIPADPRLELRLRFALFHLWNLAVRDGELAVGARSITGTGYAGHVFWDADAFVLPALVTLDPASAAAMVRYRLRRLPAARERARREGRAGARFPWESAHDGRDVTPRTGFVGAEAVTIRTGALEEHVTADVAWAVAHHATWTRPGGDLTPPERALLGDTARYWASRADRSPDGAAHLLGVIGPDEYHEDVDDDVFTNVMARWNLRHAVRHAPATESERAAWTDLADALVDGYDPRTGTYEQFRGYSALEPVTMADVGPPPIAADVLLGRAGVEGSQLVKQPDVLMAHHLVPHEVVPGSLGPCLARYGPRTAHGSSLSPAVMAALHARAGETDRALELLDLALAIDLDDIGGTAAAGIHVAAVAGAWTAVVGGFLGAEVADGRLLLDPVLPDAWPTLEVRMQCLGADVVLRVEPPRLVVDASAPLVVRLGAGCRLRPRTDSRVTFERPHEDAGQEGERP